MKSVRSSLLSSLIERKTKCKFTRSCDLYSNASYTCTHIGGQYCGRYRTLTREPKHSIIVGMNEELGLIQH